MGSDRLRASHSGFNVSMRLRSSHIDIVIKGTGNWRAWQKVQVWHVQEDTLNLGHPTINRKLKSTHQPLNINLTYKNEDKNNYRSHSLKI